ncbi:glycosyltransferase [Liquorilactobacillus ghanensis DSM 18630]|uniref:Glycosyltransferase n=1 Tax=Liquorilactobacillus ghanensis DSM 18630 TaxID=1423750 RepID=A0A0R1VN15_9LACO|nr:glycosyltransferase [Liquorilactobacillus ghanensis]KRM07130.1 glycosyltransferase [Liquorilactobacillus ghanensis DSM 18630]
MKLLSVIVPCYNAEDFMERCINSLILGGNEIQIILVDDGSIDKTGKIIDWYAKEFPQIVTAIHQKNGGHGEAINNGLKKVVATYVKIVDSDDWLDIQALHQVLNFLRSNISRIKSIDMIISNYIYDKQGSKHKKIINYPRIPTNQILSWDNLHFSVGKYLLMHSVIYRTDILKNKAKLKLPQHSFYVDNIYVFEPLIYVKKIYYLDLNLYHYFIGREDQSVNEQVMIGKIDQQLAINRQMINFYTDNVDPDTSVGKYMGRYVEIITTISSILLLKENSLRSLQLKKSLWNFIKRKDEVLYKKMRHRVFGIGVNLPGEVGRKTAMSIYRIARKVYGFN